jgi:hypothetical protein
MQNQNSDFFLEIGVQNFTEPHAQPASLFVLRPSSLFTQPEETLRT